MNKALLSILAAGAVGLAGAGCRSVNLNYENHPVTNVYNGKIGVSEVLMTRNELTGELFLRVCYINKETGIIYKRAFYDSNGDKRLDKLEVETIAGKSVYRAKGSHKDKLEVFKAQKDYRDYLKAVEKAAKVKRKEWERQFDF